MIFSRIREVVTKYPVIRNMAAYSVLYPAANLTQQKYVRKKTQIDYVEAGRYLVYGGLMHSVLVYNWVNIVFKIVPGTSFVQVLKKVALDQAFFAPTALSVFYIGLTALEFKSMEEIYEEWYQKMTPTWARGAMVWPFLQGFNFAVVPAAYRPIFVGVMSYFWTTALAYWKEEKTSISSKANKQPL